MSNISRRDFLKTAGVMTLAVAAAGVLAGCEGNAAKPEVPEVTQNSVTVGNFTMSLKNVKQVAVKTYETGTGTNETNKVKSEDRYVLAVLSMKAVDESKLTDKDETLFTLIKKPTNLEFATFGSGKGNLNKANVNELMGLTEKNVTWLSKENDEIKTLKIDSKLYKGEMNYIVAYKVETVKYKDVVDFKAPELSFIVNDNKGYTYTKMDVAIPAVEDATDKKLVNA